MNLTHELRGRGGYGCCSVSMEDLDVVRIRESDEVNILSVESSIARASGGDVSEIGPVAAIRMPMLRVSDFNGEPTASYRQLVAEAAGTPLFEIFVVKDTDRGYIMQVVYLQHVKQNLSISENSYLRAPQASNASIDNPSILDVRGSEVKVDKKEDKQLNAGEPTEEGIKNVIKFLKDK